MHCEAALNKHQTDQGTIAASTAALCRLQYHSLTCIQGQSCSRVVYARICAGQQHNLRTHRLLVHCSPSNQLTAMMLCC
jgi:hypothetical protein